MKTRKDQEQAERWIHEYYVLIYRYCYFKTTNKELAQDLTQEVFCRFFERFEHYHRVKKIKQLLFMIAHNLCVDYYRKAGREQRDEHLDHKEDKKDVEQMIAIQHILNQISPIYRETLILRFYYEFTYKEIAQIMNTSTSNVKYRTAQGKAQMKDLLKKEGMQDEEWF